jgi:hypothetical protein
MLKLKLLAPVAAFALAAGMANGQDNSALLDLLVKKKIISEQDAEAVRADLVKESAENSAAKIKIAPWIQELKLGGDLRIRYQYDNKDAQANAEGVGVNNRDEDRSPSGTQRSRWRFRLRLNADFKLADNWFGGVQLQTSQAADSGNQTFENGFSNYEIFISRAFVGWNATEWLTLVAGKQANPLYTTELIWDPDINPTGLSQSVRFHKMNLGSIETTTYSKDGKAIVGSESRESRDWELTLNMAQLVYDDNQESEFDNDASDDAYIFAGQLVASKKFGGVKVTVAPGVMFFNAADLSGFVNENAFSDVEGVSGESRKLTILTLPGDIAFKLGRIPAKFYWDFAWNLQGNGRTDDIYGLDGSHSTEDDFAWLAGVQLGENKKAGDWSVLANYRQTGISSVDPNLNDSDFAAGELNTRGFELGLAYSFTDFVSAGITYMHAWNLRDNLTGGQATDGARIAEANAVQVFQVDLNVKF